MKVYFGKRDSYFVENSYWKDIKEDLDYIFESNNADEVRDFINNHINDIGFKNYYWKYSMDNDGKWVEIDYGSYINFYLVYDFQDNEFSDFVFGKKTKETN